MTESAKAKDNPGVIAPPPLIYLGFLALGFGLDHFWPAAVLPDRARYFAGAALIALAAAVVVPAIRQFHKAGTNVPPHRPTLTLISAGPYRYSRNPMYIALSLLYAGIGVAADNLWVLVLLVPILAVVRYGVIAREERYLEGKFGEEFLRYKSKVRRWL